MIPAARSSGDIIADRRFEYARMLLAEGDAAAAADLCEQVLELVPRWPVAWSLLGDARAGQGNTAGALEAFAQCLTLAPDDELGASLRQARLLGQAPARPADAWVRGLFDGYASRFESELTGKLHYRTPQALAALLASVRPRHGSVLDLGCGTGLMGQELRGACTWLEGVDLSPGMAGEARRKGIYDRLEVADICAAMEHASRRFDLIVAADVFVYVGNLERAFTAARGCLSPGGLFAFSVEKSAAEDVELAESLRFAHSLGYIGRLAAAVRFTRIAHAEMPLRKDRGEDIAGHLVILKADD